MGGGVVLRDGEQVRGQRAAPLVSPMPGSPSSRDGIPGWEARANQRNVVRRRVVVVRSA